MGILDAAFDSVEGMLADQWQDVITAGAFDEHMVVVPGIRKNTQSGRGNNHGSTEILSNGSVIFVPENTAAFIFSQSGIEQVITEPGGYEYRNGEATVFDKRDRAEKGIGKILLDNAASRFGYAGMSPEEKRIAFVNLREIRGIPFGTRGPLAYHDLFYGTDLEVFSYGMFSVQVTDPERFVRSFVPANVSSYSLDDPRAREELFAEFLQSFVSAVNALSSTHRISQLPSQATAVAEAMTAEKGNAGTWEERFGLKLIAVGIENIEFSDTSRELVRQYAERKMNLAAYEGISEHAANVAAQQLIAEGVRENGLGDAGGMLFGMNFAQGLNPRDASAWGAVAGDAAGSAVIPAAVAGGVAASALASGGASASAAANGGVGASSAASSGDARVAPDADDMPGNAAGAAKAVDSFDAKIEALKKMKDLLDMGILTQDEFDAKKRELLSL